MGEYCTRENGKTDGLGNRECETGIKVGTCDDWRYVRRTEAQTLAIGDAGRQTDFDWALGGSSGVLFRFPFPWEDNDSVGWNVEPDRDMFKTVTLPLPADPPIMDGLTHGRMCHHIQSKGGGYQLNVYTPCPLDAAGIEKSGDFLRHDPGRPRPERDMPKPIACIYGERWHNGVPYTVFTCGYCGAPFALSGHEVESVQAHIGSIYTDRTDWMHGLTARLKVKG